VSCLGGFANIANFVTLVCAHGHVEADLRWSICLEIRREKNTLLDEGCGCRGTARRTPWIRRSQVSKFSIVRSFGRSLSVFARCDFV